MAHKLHHFNGLNIQVRPPLFLSLILRHELTAEERYPRNISLATSVPAWAYLDVVTADMFDATSAIQAVSLPESTVGNNEMSTSSSPSPSISSSETLTPAPNNKPIDTSAIVGITVGTTLGLGLIAVLILYLLTKRKRQLPSSEFAKMGATPSIGEPAAGPRSASRHPNALLLSGYSSWDHRQSGPSPPTVFQFGHMTDSPWSPPLPSSTPPRTMSPMSAQSLLSTHNYGTLSGRGTMDYHNLSSGSGIAVLPENPVV